MAKSAKNTKRRRSSHVRKGDTVMVVAGAEKGKKGRVLRSYPKSGRIVVEGVNFVKRHQRPSQQQKQGGIIEKEGSIGVSKVMVVCGKCGDATRVAHQIHEGGAKTRVCKHCGEVLD